MRTVSFSRHPGDFTVQDLPQPEGYTSRWLKIADWANRRKMIVDVKNQRTYLQASAYHEYGDGSPCGICEERMLFLRNYRHSRGPMHFIRFNGWNAYFVEYEGIPSDLNSKELSRFLCVEVKSE